MYDSCAYYAGQGRAINVPIEYVIVIYNPLYQYLSEYNAIISFSALCL